MECLKCGAETAPEEVFCRKCLDDMARNPVKPGTPVPLPPRTSPVSSKRNPHSRTLSEKEQIQRLKRRNRTLLKLLLLLAALLLASLVTLYFQVRKAPAQVTGKNYTTVVTETTAKEN